MNSEKSKPSIPSARVSPSSIRLVIRGQGHCPSFKNKKRIGGLTYNVGSGWYGSQPVLITRKDVKQWMTQAILSLQSQLRSRLATDGGATSTGCSLPCLTALFQHSKEFDDSWQWLPEITVRVEQCENGEEGAVIEISKL